MTCIWVRLTCLGLGNDKNILFLRLQANDSIIFVHDVVWLVSLLCFKIVVIDLYFCKSLISVIINNIGKDKLDFIFEN